jgi:hypothetical protein
MSTAPGSSEFMCAYTGRFWSVMSWDQLAAFWQRIDPAAGWYLYALGETPPLAPASADTVREFITRIDKLLREDHHESYCSIVYADNLDTPGFVKIYDPNNLGSSCGSSKNPPGPGWIMCHMPPDDLKPVRPAPEGRRRWWQALIGG